MIDLVCTVNNEWDTLRKVIVGIATSWGPNPTVQQAVDPKSREHILAGTYPISSDVYQELEGLVTVLKEHGVEVLRPENSTELNQVFARDVGAVIENKLIKSSMIAERAPEWLGVSGIFSPSIASASINLRQLPFVDPILKGGEANSRPFAVEG